jgi:hypothetical protein
MASIKVKGRVPVFCAWDGDVPLDADFMVVVCCCCNVFRFFVNDLHNCDLCDCLRVVEVDRSGCYTDGRIEQLDSGASQNEPFAIALETKAAMSQS